MDKSVTEFFTKNAVENYAARYRLDHSPRIKAMIDRYNLRETLAGKRLVDVGGGLGFAGELLDPTTDYWVIDGARVADEAKVAKGTWRMTDLDHDDFQFPGAYKSDEEHMAIGYTLPPSFDAAFVLEVLEHLAAPYHCLSEVKKLVKIGGEVYISVPTESVWHNTPNPFTFWPPQNFEIFLNQMALPVRDFYVYQPKDRGWPAYQFKCENRPWSEKKPIFPKDDPKFRDCTMIEMTNL